MNAPSWVPKLVAETRAARIRTADKGIATRVDRGLIQIVRIEWLKSGAGIAHPLTDYVDGPSAIAFLQSMGNE